MSIIGVGFFHDLLHADPVPSPVLRRYAGIFFLSNVLGLNKKGGAIELFWCLPVFPYRSIGGYLVVGVALYDPHFFFGQTLWRNF